MRRLLLTAFLVFAPFAASAVPPIRDAAPVAYVPPAAERVVLSNGVVVYLYEDHELPLFDLQIRFKASPVDEKPVHAFSLMGAVWRSGGTKNLPSDALDERLESLAASVETGSDNESLFVSVSCLSRDMDAVLDLWVDVMLNPAFDPKKLAIAKGQALEGLRRKNETPGQVGRRAFRDVIYGPAHPYADDPLPEEIGKISRGHLQAIHRRVVAPDAAYISAAGDFDSQALIAALERRFARWPKTGRVDPPFDYSVMAPAEGRVFLVEKDFSQSRISVGTLGIDRHHPDRFSLTLADYILGGGGPSRLFAEIRSRRGLAYMVGSFCIQPTGRGMVGAVSQSKAGATVAVIDAMLAEFKRMSAEPVTPEELDLAKASIVNASVFNYDRPFEIAQAHANREFFDYEEDELETRDRKLLAVTREQVLAAARKYYDPAGLKIVVVGDSKKFDGSLEKFGEVRRIPIEKID